jgi:hypothetical protein
VSVESQSSQIHRCTRSAEEWPARCEARRLAADTPRVVPSTTKRKFEQGPPRQKGEVPRRRSPAQPQCSPFCATNRGSGPLERASSAGRRRKRRTGAPSDCRSPINNTSHGRKLPELGMVWPRALKLQKAQVRSVGEEIGSCSSARGNGPPKKSGRVQEGGNRWKTSDWQNAHADHLSACSSAS